MLFHPLTNFETSKYCQKDRQVSLKSEPKFDGVFPRNNLPKIKYGAYVINLDKFKSTGTHWIALHVNGNNRRAYYNAISFDSFGVEHIPKEINNS